MQIPAKTVSGSAQDHGFASRSPYCISGLEASAVSKSRMKRIQDADSYESFASTPIVAHWFAAINRLVDCPAVKSARTTRPPRDLTPARVSQSSYQVIKRPTPPDFPNQSRSDSGAEGRQRQERVAARFRGLRRLPRERRRGPIDLDDDFPSDDSAQPAHPNCKRALSPVVCDDDSAAKRATLH
jgi:hypothetical protein